MAFNIAEIMNSRHGGGKHCASYGKEEITLDLASAGVELPKHYFTLEANEERPLYKFVYREAFGYHLEPVERPEGVVGPMFSGVYAVLDYKVRKELEAIVGHPVPEAMRVMDRFETPEMYDFLSR